MNHYAQLTATDKIILESYKSVLDGLSEYLGSGYEMILHSLDDIDHSAIKVINGHYTGRKEGSPITDLALEMLGKINKCDNNNKNLIYINQSQTGGRIRSATIPITGEGDQIIGLLCINLYMDLPLNLFLENLIKIPDGNYSVVETFANNSDELILTTLNKAKLAIHNNAAITISNRNKEIIAILFQKEIFNLKDAVVKVAEYLGISKNTVYLHLRNLQNSMKD